VQIIKPICVSEWTNQYTKQ